MQAIATLYGPQSAELASGSYLYDMQASYRNTLAADGVAFPDAELQAAKLQHDAYAAQQRGSWLLNPDGSPIRIDASTYNTDAVGQKIIGGIVPLQNEEKLGRLCSMALISHAGALAIDEMIDTDTVGPEDIESYADLNLRYKHFVQTAIAIEEWGLLWDKIVRDEFPGESLRFPLDAIQIAYTGALLHSPAFQTVRDANFEILPLIEYNLGTELRAFEPDDPIATMHGHFATAAGVFYRTSPDGATSVLDRMITDGYLPANGGWHTRVGAAVAGINHLFR